jgi:hypothetical protein
MFKIHLFYYNLLDLINMKNSIIYSLAVCLCLASTSSESFAKKKKKAPAPVAEAPKKDAKKTIKETVKASKLKDGLFALYQDTTNGSVYMKIKKSQLNKEFIYFNYAENGAVSAGYFKGSFRDNEIFSIKKYYDKIEFIKENTSYYFDKENAISKSADANINKPILASLKIVAEDGDDYLIKADELFLVESLSQIKPSPNPRATPGSAFSLGTLSKEKTKFASLRNYPQNTDIVVEYVYDNPSPTNFGGPDVTDPRSVTVKIQHSIIEVPKNNFVPRNDDPRVGYFMQQTEDMTSTSATPYHDFINRWNLEKKDPNAALSEPVTPITWWIENTTPLEFRETIKAAVLTWNMAFEKAGFKNAIRCEVQPDTATWDAGDIRYNVLRWTSSPFPPFGGYGPSFVNPRTGEILGADIMLEYVFFTNRLRQEKLFDAAALNIANEFPELNVGHNGCDIGNHFTQATQFGNIALSAYSASDIDKKQYIKESLFYLVLHEVGHTFGLNHNMKSSQLHDLVNVHNKAVTSKIGLTGSVMDYPAANVALDKAKQGQYFTSIPGPYDMWAIEFGYTPSLTDANAEATRVKKLLSRSNEPQLTFGNDADDMRAPGKGIDPRVMIGDMSSDAIGYSIDRMKLSNNILKGLKSKYVKEGQSYHELRNAYLTISGEYNVAAGVISRYIGGVYVDRSFPEQKSTAKPMAPVAYADQKRAMKALNDYVFAPTAFDMPADFYAYLQYQRRGFNGGNEDPKIHERVLNMQKGVLAHLLSANVTKRIVDIQLIGNTYSLTEMMRELTDGIFKADAAGNVNSFRQNLQLEYVNMLISAMKSDAYVYQAKSTSLAQLKAIKTMMAAGAGNAETKAHREHIVFAINKAMEK